jgi:ribonucleoside-triphosphate reductase (thioredoxin)
MLEDNINKQYGEFVFKSRYSRWLYDKQRRETWDETVDRYIKFFGNRIPIKFRKKASKQIRDAIYNHEVMPSMRALMTAGPALEKDNTAGYNCSFLAVDNPRAFDEAMYISMYFPQLLKISIHPVLVLKWKTVKSVGPKL